MSWKTLTRHRVDGIGRQINHNTDQPLNPTTYERAIHGLQEIILETAFHDSEPTQDEYDSPHEEITEDGEKQIHIAEDTVLHDVCKLFIPQNWDVTVLTDDIREHGYGVRASVACGGNITVMATIFVEDDSIRRLDIAHNAIHDPEEINEVKSITPNESARETAHINRWLETSVTHAYAKAIPSAATAFDFTATKHDIPSSGKRHQSYHDRRENITQTEWATIRGKTKQTVSDNVRSAREALHDLPDPNAFDERHPALREIEYETDHETTDIRLV